MELSGYSSFDHNNTALGAFDLNLVCCHSKILFIAIEWDASAGQFRSSVYTSAFTLRRVPHHIPNATVYTLSKIIVRPSARKK